MVINRMPRPALVLAFSAFVATGCNNGSDSNLAYKTAIDQHFKALPACIWPQPKKFPAQAATADDAKTAGYDALTQEGLLTRTTGEKKVVIFSKQVNNYDLSDKGRSSWTPDTSQPGYGNFCYGNREVTSIDSATPGTNGQGAKTADGACHYRIANVPGWAHSQEMQTAFPDIASALGSNPSDRVTLVMTGDRWEFQR